MTKILERYKKALELLNTVLELDNLPPRLEDGIAKFLFIAEGELTSFPDQPEPITDYWLSKNFIYTEDERIDLVFLAKIINAHFGLEG